MLLDLGCGLGATLRSIARRLPHARLLGLTRVPWQVEHAHALNVAAACDERVRVIQGDYEDTSLPSGSVDGAYALESSCHGHGADKSALLWKGHRLLRPGGRLVVADGFLSDGRFCRAVQQRIYRRLCGCWVIEELGQLHLLTAGLEKLGFTDTTVARLQLRVAPLGGAHPVGDSEVPADRCFVRPPPHDACALEQCSRAGAPATSQRATRTNDYCMIAATKG